MNETILNRVRLLVADVLGLPLETVGAETSYHSVSAWDSVNIVKLAMAAEAEFGVAVSPDDAVNFTSVSAIVEVMEKKGAK
jgi:acyl carrier protein